jgi:uncharacterized membrane protein
MDHLRSNMQSGKMEGPSHENDSCDCAFCRAHPTTAPLETKRKGRVARLRRPWSVQFFVILILLGLALCALPLRGRGTVEWRDMNGPLVVGTLILALGVFWAITLNFSARVAGIYGLVAMTGSWMMEVAGIHCRFPFGSTYRYHPELAPRLPGHVPLFIPLAWYVLSGSSLIMLRGTWLLAPGTNGRVRVLLARSCLSGIFVAGCDLVLDPLATSVGAWTWAVGGPYFGVPWSNFLGWCLVGLTIHLIASRWVGQAGLTPAPAPRPFARVWLGANLGALFLVAMAARARLPSLQPLALAMAVVGPFLAAWWYAAQRDGEAAHDWAPTGK